MGSTAGQCRLPKTATHSTFDSFFPGEEIVLTTWKGSRSYIYYSRPIEDCSELETETTPALFIQNTETHAVLSVDEGGVASSVILPVTSLS